MCIHPSASMASAVRSGVVPVAAHHRVAARAQLARLAALDGGGRSSGSATLTSTWGWTRPTVAVRWCERVVGQRLGRHRRRLGHAVADRHLAHVHRGRCTPSSPRPGTASRPSPRCAATSGRSVEVGVAELGDEHRRHAVERRAALGLRPPRASAPGSNAVGRDHHRGAVRGAAEVAHDHAEAVVEGHRDAQPVARR